MILITISNYSWWGLYTNFYNWGAHIVVDNESLSTGNCLRWCGKLHIHMNLNGQHHNRSIWTWYDIWFGFRFMTCLTWQSSCFRIKVETCLCPLVSCLFVWFCVIASKVNPSWHASTSRAEWTRVPMNWDFHEFFVTSAECDDQSDQIQHVGTPQFCLMA